MADNEVSQAGEILRLILPMMAKHAVPVLPRNYAVWYEYAAGNNAPLTAEIDDLLGAEISIAPQMERLFHTYIIDAQFRATSETRATLNELLETVSQTVETANDDISQYEDTLSGAMRGLGGESNAQKLRHTIEVLTYETRSVRQSGEQLRSKLVASRREAEALREELEHARQAADTDPLTGVANRAVFQRSLNELIAEAQQGGTDIGLLMVDIDHFKAINDNHGHLVGDRVIRFLAKLMTERVKGRDIVSRYGGEEFTILLPDTDIAGAVTVAENIRDAMEKSRLVRSGSKEPIGQVTISIGAATYRVDEEADEFLDRADQALYHSKQNGRNRVTSELAIFDRQPVAEAG
ncbi:MAG: GGDEF domain-containing protein [Gammaproteobacteria bacterium]|nr:GGDEF domain-containing protein [Gammaproteobacteria bacterium]